MTEPTTPPTEERTLSATVHTVIRLGQATAHLENALHSLHAAMALTPLPLEAVGDMAQTGSVIAGHIQAHYAAWTTTAYEEEASS